MAAAAAANIVGRNHHSRRGGCIILLDVPPGSAITLDGVTRVTPSSSSFDNRGLWIIDQIIIPSTTTSINTSLLGEYNSGGDGSNNNNNNFHLLVVRPGTPDNIKNNCNDAGGGFRRALPVGFILFSTTSSSSSSDSGYDWVFARKYDRYTEEMSNEENVDPLTLRNILLAMNDGDNGAVGELKQHAIPYERFITMSSSSSSMRCNYGIDGKNMQQEHALLPSWEARTSVIDPCFLRQCHKISTNGSKIVPSSYGSNNNTSDDDDDDNNHHICNNKSPGCNNIIDGKAISYPPIPCIDPTIDARRLVQHSGTRSYLSALSPTERTRLLISSNEGRDGGVNDSSCHAESPPMMDNDANPWKYSQRQDSSGEHVWNDVLCRYYGDKSSARKAFYGGGGGDSGGGGGGGISRSECHFLADIELSFLLILHLECQSSLEFWRDAVSMCSLSVVTTSSSSSPSSNLASRHPLFFHKLLSILYIQLSCIESDFFGDVEYSSGSDNFAVLALKRLCDACDCVGGRRRKREEKEVGDGRSNDAFDDLKLASRQLKLLARDKFGLDLSLSSQIIAKDGVEENDDDDEDDALWSSTGVDAGEDSSENVGKIESRNNQDMDDIHSDDEDEDGPVIIPYDEIEASLVRSSMMQTTSQTMMRCNADGYKNMEEARTLFASEHKKEFPLLYAALLSSTGEDEVMACARILDEKNDVSLVREAAAYLERVEAHFRDGE